ncbi:MAG: GGDEF domain-containing protein [Alphaproteobacteria bacterium]|nr:GGDEF domain-containing protein [Alphaproteobacteria bacterium]
MSESQASIVRSRELAEQALKLMTGHRIAATPRNYEIFFTYASGERGELVGVVDSYLKRGAAFTDQVTNVIHSRFFPNAGAGTEVLEVGDQMQLELSKLADSLESAGRDQREYGDTLTRVSGALDVAGDTDAIRAQLARLNEATARMTERTRALETRLEASREEVAKLKDNLENFKAASLTDPLTGLPNRRCLDERLRQALDEARESGKPLSILMSDIDHFKAFNDNWGHQTGDQVLRLVAACLRDSVKGRDTAARYGGEEFAVILPETRLEDALTVAEQIRRTVETKRIVKRSTGQSLGTVTLSLGAATLQPGEDAEALLQRADACLYAAKRGGRNRVIGEGSLDAQTAAEAGERQRLRAAG